MIPNPKMDAHSRALQAAARRGKARQGDRAKRAQAAAKAAVKSLQKAHLCVVRADEALRTVEGREDDQALEVEAAAAGVKAAHERCDRSAKQAGFAARRRDPRGAETAARVCANEADKAADDAKAARLAARRKAKR